MGRIPISISLNDVEIERMDQLMAKRGIRNRSELFRELILNSKDTQTGLNNALVEYGVRDIAQLLGVHMPEHHPPMSGDGLCIARILAEHRAEHVLAGVLPLVPEDARAAGLDVHSRHVWELYHGGVQRLYCTMLGRPMSVDPQFDPLHTINGEYAGALLGEVIGIDYTFPDDTIQYAAFEVSVDRIVVLVTVPVDICPVNQTGVTIYAAGTFGSVRGRAVMKACKCTLSRAIGFEPIYELTERWGLDEKHASNAIIMLRRIHGGQAVAMAPVFCRWCMGESMRLELPGGKIMRPAPRDILATQDGSDFPKCITRWHSVLNGSSISKY